jgi:hypothetical protein
MRPHLLPLRTRRGASGFVEWDDTPSFAESLPNRLSWNGSQHGAIDPGRVVYAETMPAALMPVPASTPFSEPVEGLSVREVNDLDVFRHFFSR